MASVGIHDRAPGARLFTGPCASPRDRDVLTYLRASGASAISITANHDGTARVRVDADRAAAAAWRVPADQADEVVRRARATAGARPDTDAMTAALMQTATELRVSLTPHETALQRAALGEMVPLSEIPYLDKAQIGPDRFLASLTFHDEAWHTWVHVSDNRFMEIRDGQRRPSTSGVSLNIRLICRCFFWTSWPTRLTSSN